MPAILRITFCVAVLTTAGLAQDLSTAQIVEKAKSAYAAMETYRDEGAVTVEISGTTAMKIETTFSIRMKKPNMYLISWTQNTGMSTNSGAVWNDGTQAYVLMEKSYSKMSSDEMALAAATGISGGAAFTVPSLFLPVFGRGAGHLSRLNDFKVEAPEKVGDEDCYVLSGTSGASKKESYWISKSRFLILKYARSLEAPGGGQEMPELTDDQLEQAIKSMGGQPTPENKQQMKAMMEQARAMRANMQISGWSTELHTGVQSPAMAKEDVTFAVPAGAVLKDSIFQGLLGGAKPKP